MSAVGMPDVGDIAREQRPGLTPVGTIVILDHTGRPAAPGTFALTGLDGIISPGRIVVDAIGRVGDHEMRGGTGQQAGHVIGIGAVAAQQAVGAEVPEITWARDGRLGKIGRRLIGQGRGLLVGHHESRQFLRLKAQAIEAEAGLIEHLEFVNEQHRVPDRQLGRLVVADAEGRRLLGRQVEVLQHRHALEAQHGGGRQPSMAGEHDAILIDLDRRAKANLLDHGGKLLDALLIHLARVALVGLHLVDRPQAIS